MRTHRMLISALVFPVALMAGSDRIQAPDARWKTFTTAHYRIHFPANPAGGFEPFALEVASKIEGIHTKVTEYVGFEAKGPIDVVLRDPVMEANGMAMALLKRPMVELWKSPPELDSAIGHFGNWTELLVVHELTHIHHMMRPQNKPNVWDKVLDLPMGPLARKTPRWALEGYATLVEGRITGSGRPHSVYRAAMLRQWALQGKLPDYGAVSNFGGFRGGSMAYLVGSAYLEWLERQNAQDPDILKKFWKQLVSRKRRAFDPSFRATFGLAARDGYDRWRAEVMHDALALERRVKGQGLLREGELFARFDGEVSDLAVSPDGSKLLARVITNSKPGIRVWDLAPKVGEKKATKKEETPDPNEVDDRKPDFAEPETLGLIRRRNGAVPRHAWWTTADQITFELRYPDSEGVLQPRFLVADFKTKRVGKGRPPADSKPSTFRWKELEGTWNLVKIGTDGKEQQLTRTLSAAWQPAPTPDGNALFYVQLSATGCEIRKLDLKLPPLAETPLPLDEKPLTPKTIFSAPDEASLLPPAGKAPDPKDYSVWTTHDLGSRFGATVMPSGAGTQVGVGGSDLLGRLSWRALGGIGHAMGPRGATFGIAYRGWQWAPSLEVFSSLEKPSRQDFAPVLGFDRERRGAELGFTYVDRGVIPQMLNMVLASERLAFLGMGRTQTRSLAGLRYGTAFMRSRGEDWGLGARAEARIAAGRTDHQSWNLSRGEVGLRLKTAAGILAVQLESGRMQGSPTAADQFHLGGQTTSLVPASLDWNRVEQVALPAYLQVGNRMQRFRSEFTNNLRVYLEHAAVWDSTKARPAYLRVIGLELPVSAMLPGRINDLFLGGFTFTLGVHRALDGVMKDRTVGTVSLVVRP